MTLELIPLEGLPEVEPGDDLAALLEPSLVANAASDGDVVAVTQKIVSKAEGRMVPGEDRGAWVERETVDVVARRGDLVITRTRHGFVCANAGVDASNVREGFLTLLPEDPDASAERLQKELSARLGLSRLGVVITDTFGRPWREGVVDVAIGCAGLPPLVDLRGTGDDHGKELETTVVALADAVAAASGLVMTKTARVPAALVRGLGAATGDAPPGPASALVRRPEDDLFRESALIAVSAAEQSVAFGPGEVSREIVEDAVGAACAVPLIGAWSFVALDSPAARRRVLAAAGADDVLRAAPILILPCVRVSAETSEETIMLSGGATIRTLVVALHAQRIGWSWDPRGPFDAEGARAALALGEGWRPLGIVAVGPMAEGGASRPRPSA
ncbi:MAG: coenzyme F420-0:L-glutamate ligase, partial [Actinomycetota bacterium]|nr:coenzyme F420-0:L-glutamate ligase [Actinomycetota bacterium]